MAEGFGLVTNTTVQRVWIKLLKVWFGRWNSCSVGFDMSQIQNGCKFGLLTNTTVQRV